MAMLETKRCKECGEEKPHSAFAKTRGYRARICRKCQRSKESPEARASRLGRMHRYRHSEKGVETYREYREANRARIRVLARANGEKHREQKNERLRQKRHRDPDFAEKLRDRDRRYRRNHPDRVREQNKRYARENREKIRAYNRANPDKELARTRRYRDSEKGAFFSAKQRIKEATGIPVAIIPDDMARGKIVQLRIFRLIAELKRTKL